MTRHASRQSTRSRSMREWMLRGGLATTVAVVGFVSVTQTLADVLSKTSPERAHALSPYDGRIAADLAKNLSAEGATTADRARAGRIARAALAEEPLSVSAVTVLALNAQLAGDSEAAKRLFEHSDSLSRRELPTRLWLIEDAVERGDVAGAVRHYDIALRTSRNAPALLFPVLGAAVADAQIANVLGSTLARRPPWGDAFVQYLSTSGPNSKVTADFFRLLAARHVTVPEGAQTATVNALVASNAFNEAWTYYRTLRRGADRRRSRDPEFAAQLAAPTVFDWVPVMNEAGITASIQRTATNGVFDFAAPPTVGGIVLEQLQLLPAGRYRITGHSIGIDQPEQSRPYWALICTDGREIGRVELPNSARNEGRFGGIVTVSGTCHAQLLRFVARPSNLVSGASGQIDDVTLAPLP